MSSDEAVTSLSAMTGLPTAEATGFLEMAGGNLDTAISLFFSMQDGGGGGGAPAPAASLGWEAPDWYSLVWQNPSDQVPEAWLKQGLAFEGLGLPQHKNGPCGVLAAVQGRVVARLLRAAGEGAAIGADTTVTPAVLAATIAEMLTQCSGAEQPTVLASWAGQVGQEVTLTEIASAVDVEAAVSAALDGFVAPGGCCLLLYSLLLSRGVAAVRADAAAGMGEPPLVIGANAVCSTELMSLCLRGTANGNFGAYTQTKAPHNWELGDVGMLSYSELETSIPVCDSLKTPRLPVWLLHGGDHFTLLIGTAITTASTTAGETEESGDSGGAAAAASPVMTLLHYNGLPPAGPRMAELEVRAPHGAAPAVGAAAHEESFQAPLPGTIEGVVQAVPEDKRARPDDCTSWRYEVVLAVPDPDHTIYGEGKPHTEEDKAAAITFEQGPAPGPTVPWRCATCYRTRFETMCFGMNEAGATHCQHPHCGGAQISDCGWSLTLPFADLPNGWQQTMERTHGPKITGLLRTKWPGCQISFTGSDAGLPFDKHSAPSV